jgi:hypothetical protein
MKVVLCTDPAFDAFLPPDWSGKSTYESFDKDDGFSEHLTELRRNGNQLHVTLTSTLNGQVQGSSKQVYEFDRFYPELGRVRLYGIPTQTEHRSAIHLDVLHQKLLQNEEFFSYALYTPGKQPPNSKHEYAVLTALWQLANVLVPELQHFSPDWQAAWHWQESESVYGQKRTWGIRPIANTLFFKTLQVKEEDNRISYQWFHLMGLPLDFRLSAVVRGHDSHCQTEVCLSLPYEYHFRAKTWVDEQLPDLLGT